MHTCRCKIVDKHLAILAKKHVETKFIKLNVEKAPFLAERLHIKVIPTLALLIDGKSKDYVVGFGDLGNTDEFSTEMLEWRLGCADVINYRYVFSGDALQSFQHTSIFLIVELLHIVKWRYRVAYFCFNDKNMVLFSLFF